MCGALPRVLSQSGSLLTNGSCGRVVCVLCRYVAAEGDHLTLLNVLKAYEQAGQDATWCRAHFVNRRALTKALVRGAAGATCHGHAEVVTDVSHCVVQSPGHSTAAYRGV